MSERECRTFEKKLAHFTAPTLLGIKTLQDSIGQRFDERKVQDNA